MDTATAQKEIKSIISKLGWSQNRLAREIYVATYDSEDHIDSDDEMHKLEEKLKKELSRNTTKPERLIQYLEVISRHNEFKNLNLVIPTYIESTRFSASFKSSMSTISKNISADIENADSDYEI